MKQNTILHTMTCKQCPAFDADAHILITPENEHEGIYLHENDALDIGYTIYQTVPQSAIRSNCGIVFPDEPFTREVVPAEELSKYSIRQSMYSMDLHHGYRLHDYVVEDEWGGPIPYTPGVMVNVPEVMCPHCGKWSIIGTQYKLAFESRRTDRFEVRVYPFRFGLRSEINFVLRYNGVAYAKRSWW